MTDLSFFITFFADDGPNCFDASEFVNGVDNPNAVDGYLSQAGITKRNRGKAQFSFWFLGYPRAGPGPNENEPTDRILYGLFLIGEPELPSFNGDWLPTATTAVSASTWELSTEGGPSGGCEGSGDMNFLVCADVTLVGTTASSPCTSP